MTLEVPQNQISEELVQGQSKPQEILYEAIVNNLTRSESASRLVSCGVPQGLVLNPSHLKKKKKKHSSGKIGKLTRCLHLTDVLLEVVSLLDDLIDHVVHGQPSLHVPAETQQVKLI